MSDELCKWCGGSWDEAIVRLTRERDAALLRVAKLEAALRPLAEASRVSSVRPVYAIGVRFGAPYNFRAAEAAVQTARALLADKEDDR